LLVNKVTASVLVIALVNALAISRRVCLVNE
jgi:hypothetical protein